VIVIKQKKLCVTPLKKTTDSSGKSGSFFIGHLSYYYNLMDH